MRILIEEYKYNAADVRDVLKGIDALENVEGYVSVNYVGYFFNTQLPKPDCVFILPKVLLEDINKQELVFGKYRPEDIINIDNDKFFGDDNERKFIYEFSVWIYRAIVVFYADHKDSDIVYHKRIAQVGKGGRRLSNTFLDILLSLIQFNKDNQDFFFFILRNIHSGFNKINWTRTIGKSTAIVQNESPVYLNPVNKKRQINFDEELLVIFFSILNYIGDEYGFPKNINCNFNLIKGAQFKAYLNGMGKVRLHQIKYKYFSDKALELWNLCYAFFDSARQVYVNSDQKEYLLVKNFNVVFEAIIDELIGDKNIPQGLKEQNDGKRVDHMFTYKGLTDNQDGKDIYYIGDSKYYKIGNQVGKESVYKQFTYARNVIQWNLNLFMSEDNSDKALKEDRVKYGNVDMLRDPVTEGYNIIPNFFISARLNKEYDARPQITLSENGKNSFDNIHFENRLFDRDTLLICHYDVNFLHVVSLYARNNASQKKSWKEEVRGIFRAKIQEMLQDKYDFYAIKSKPGVMSEEFIKEHFHELNGKVFAPYRMTDSNGEPNNYSGVYSLALDNKDTDGQNDNVKSLLEECFYIEKYRLGDDPLQKFGNVPEQESGSAIVSGGELVGYTEHLDWVKSTKQYPIRLNNFNKSFVKIVNCNTMLITDGFKGLRMPIATTKINVVTKAQLLEMGYPNPSQENYVLIKGKTPIEYLDKVEGHKGIAGRGIDV